MKQNTTSSNRVLRIAAVFIILTSILFLLYIAANIIAPLILSLLLAILLHPVEKFLHNKCRIPTVLSVLFTIIFAALITIALVGFLGMKFALFLDDLPMINKQIQVNFHELQRWIQESFGYDYSEQQNYFNHFFSSNQELILNSFNKLTSSLYFFVLIPIYTFFILIYRSLLLNFIIKLTPESKVANTQKILINLKHLLGNYIVGLVIQVICISTLIGFAYYLIGMKYFVFLGILTGLLNLIPYIGIIIAGVLSCLVALTITSDLSIIFWVIGVNGIVQFFDNNFLVPKVIGSQVSINALASLVGVIVGGAIAGISGMFLAIPVLAILKVLLDSSPNTEPFGYLLGDDFPRTIKSKRIRSKKKAIKNEETNSND